MNIEDAILGKQKPLPLIGVYKQLLGGAMSWITLITFVFSGIAAWNTSTLAAVRDVFPWLTLPIFAGILGVGLHGAMWLEHKYVQPSVMVYWTAMFYNHGNPMKKDIEALIQEVKDLRAEVAALRDETGEPRD